MPPRNMIDLRPTLQRPCARFVKSKRNFISPKAKGSSVLIVSVSAIARPKVLKTGALLHNVTSGGSSS